MILSPTTVLEASMLVCFGFAWPLANLRMLRLRRAEGRGRAATLLTLTGYGAGMAAKLIVGQSGAGLPPIFWLYLPNAISVAMNLALQEHFRPVASALAAVPKQAATPIGVAQAS